MATRFVFYNEPEYDNFADNMEYIKELSMNPNLRLSINVIRDGKAVDWEGTNITSCRVMPDGKHFGFSAHGGEERCKLNRIDRVEVSIKTRKGGE